jgi:hypothetical protein
MRYLDATETLIAAVQAGNAAQVKALYLGESGAAREVVVAELDKLRQMNIDSAATAGTRCAGSL